MAREEGIELIYVNTKAHEWLTLKDEAILLPMGMKEHINHIVLHEAVLDARNELKQEANATVYLGEDQPYTGLADTNDWDILIDKPIS